VDATLLAGDEDTAWVRRIVAAVSLVDISAFDLATDKLLGWHDRCVMLPDGRFAC
jgi:hypothetical protein